MPGMNNSIRSHRRTARDDRIGCEIADRLERAGRALRTARINLRSGDPDGAADRAYFAAFHAASAVFLREGLY